MVGFSDLSYVSLLVPSFLSPSSSTHLLNLPRLCKNDFSVFRIMSRVIERRWARTEAFLEFGIVVEGVGVLLERSERGSPLVVSRSG